MEEINQEIGLTAIIQEIASDHDHSAIVEKKASLEEKVEKKSHEEKSETL